MRPVNRIEPKLPASLYETYAIARGRDTTVKTACEQAGCLAWQYGWESKIDESTDLGARQATYIRAASGRTFREARDGALTVFRFEPKQRCFAEHHTRPEAYAVLGGDWRAYSGVRRRHTRPIDWVEDMGETLQRVADEREKG